MTNKFKVMGYKHGAAVKKDIFRKLKSEGFVSVGDVYDLVGEVPQKEDYIIGWTELSGKTVRVREIKSGWYLYLPPCQAIQGCEDISPTEEPNPYQEFIDIIETIIKDVLSKQFTIHTRPCIVKAKKSGPKEVRKDRKAYFHRWFESTKGVSQLLGLVEFSDGHVEQVLPTNIIFTDRTEE